MAVAAIIRPYAPIEIRLAVSSAPELGVNSGRGQVERKNRPSFDKPLDESLPLRTDSTLECPMNSMEQFGSYSSRDGDIRVGDLRRHTFQVE